ncbi:MAG: hypothetical protein ACI4SO_07575 [Muribaculaceae bacterium]
MNKIEKAILCSDYKGVNIYTLNRFNEDKKRMFIVHFNDFLKKVEYEQITDVMSRLKLATAKVEYVRKLGIVDFQKFEGPEFGGGFFTYGNDAKEVYENVTLTRNGDEHKKLFLRLRNKKYNIFERVCNLLQNKRRYQTQSSFDYQHDVEVFFEDSKIFIKDWEGNTLTLCVE